MTRPVDPLGAQLRDIRNSLGLSLQRLEEKSDGRFKAVVVGSWERGDRRTTIGQARALLDWYGGWRIEVLAPGDVVMHAGALDHGSGNSVEYVVMYGPDLQWTVPCEDVVEAGRIAAHLPGSQIGYRAMVVGPLTVVDGVV